MQISRGAQYTTAGGVQVITSPDGRSTSIVERGRVTTVTTTAPDNVVVTVNGRRVSDATSLNEAIQRVAESSRPIGVRNGTIRIDGRALQEPELLALGGAAGAAAMFVALTTLYMVARFVRSLVRRKPAPVVATLPAELSPRVERIEQAVETIAIEVERVAEAQRFSAMLLAERLPNAQPNAQPGRLAPERIVTPH